MLPDDRTLIRRYIREKEPFRSLAAHDLGEILAAEEHHQGLQYTADPDHCVMCAEVDRAWAQATCGHSNVVEFPELCEPYRWGLCNDCGAEVRRDLR